MAKESVLSIEDKEAIVIERLIFHIILTDAVTPIFLDKVVITPEQQRFFKDRLSDFAQGRQYIFDGDSPLKAKAIEIIDADDDGFVRLSKDIANMFKLTHTNNTSNGVFIISIASIRERKLLFLVKLDHKKIYQYKINDGQALLEEVKNTFSEDKSSIQKVALIDVSDCVLWDALVFDRGARGSKNDITDYFRNFLSVLPRETDTDLTKKSMTITRQWASNNKTNIDPSQEPSYYKIRAQQYLMNHDIFDTDEFIEAVIQDADSNRRARLITSFREYLVQNGLAGQIFMPKGSVFVPSMTKHIRRTAEGVKIEWNGNARDNNIDIPNVPDTNGRYKITIFTNGVEDIQ